MLPGNTPADYNRIDSMTEVELWRNFQIYRNWLGVVGYKKLTAATDDEVNNLKFGCKVKNRLQAVLKENDINISLTF
jgi:hypothetical protein